MFGTTDRYRRWQAIKVIVLIALVTLLGWYARLPRLTAHESAVMAERFRFERKAFPRMGENVQRHRTVNPRLERIAAWISAVGAGVALGDLDGDGLSNDACLTDPRTDQVIITPVPGTGERYSTFVLTPSPLPYNPSAMAPMGCLITDLNEDGLQDLVVYYWGHTPIAFLHRKIKDAISLSANNFVPQELVPGRERWYTNAALTADVDGDGHADLIFGNYFPDGSVVLGTDGPVGMQASMSSAGNGGSKHILLWKAAIAGDAPSVRFESASDADAVLGNGWTLAMAACDIDGDFLPDLIIINDFGPDLVLHNLSRPGHLAFQRLHGRRGLTTPKSKVLGQDSFKGMGVDCADINGDGIPDFVVSNITDSYALQESNLVYISTGDTKSISDGVAPYREEGEILGLARSGWSWDVRFGDFDNSGDEQIVQATGFVQGSVDRWPELQELAMGNDLMLSNPDHWPRFMPGDDLSGNNHDRFWVRSRSGKYFDLATNVGLGDPLVTRGVAVADVNGDGRLDFALANQWNDSLFFLNASKSTGAFLGLHVLLPVVPGPAVIRDGHPAADTRGYPAIGARVTVYLPDGRILVKQVDGGNGHSGKSSPDLHFGLGPIKAQPLHVKFDWRDQEGTVRTRDVDLMPGWHTVLLEAANDKH